VRALIREWRFQAASDNGAAVQSHALFDLAKDPEPVYDLKAAPKKK
jgi:hypothetical protein